jgi:HNH endonuclease
MFTFEDNMDNKPVVNHKDENKLNNDLDNLEWMTEQENCAHSRGKKVRQIDMKTNECIQVFNSIRDIYRQFNKQYSSTIRKACNGQRKSLFGYKWEWDD